MSKEKKFLGFVLLAACMIFSVVAVYSAGTIDLPKTGQTLCYYYTGSAWATCTCGSGGSCLPGQDGEIQAGAAWPSPRFTSSDSGSSITDNMTGLVWLKDAGTPTTTTPACTGGTKNWAAALSYIACLNGGSGYLSHTDWRLPNIVELDSLYHPGYRYLEGTETGDWLEDTVGFTNVATAHYWASTTYAAQQHKAWTIYFRNNLLAVEGEASGSAEETKETKNFYVWPVRGGNAL